jgi:hypothetical protein
MNNAQIGLVSMMVQAVVRVEHRAGIDAVFGGRSHLRPRDLRP